MPKMVKKTAKISLDIARSSVKKRYRYKTTSQSGWKFKKKEIKEKKYTKVGKRLAQS